MAGIAAFGGGWSGDLPDVRDFTPSTPEIRAALGRLKRRRSSRSPKPAAVDHREFCVPAKSNQPPHAASAEAVLGMLEYFERRATGRYVERSRSFVHYVSQRLEGLAADGPCGLRSTLRAVARFGAPPERFCPFDSTQPAASPDAFAYQFQRDFAGLAYLRLDLRNETGGETLRRVKAFVAAGWACVCGTALPRAGSPNGELPFPTLADEPGDGAALTIVGYDDAYRIRSTKGALIVRGSSLLGDGYGRLPYRYVEEQLARDFWTVLRPAWTASDEFEQPV